MYLPLELEASPGQKAVTDLNPFGSPVPTFQSALQIETHGLMLRLNKNRTAINKVANQIEVHLWESIS